MTPTTPITTHPHPHRSTPPASTRSTHAKRSGFAMLMVISLLVVVSIMAAVILDRQGVQNRVAARQITWYQEHHARLGLQEAIEAWIRILPSRTELTTILPENGHFLDLDLKDGTTASIWFVERQNAILNNLVAVAPDLQSDAAALIEHAHATYGQTDPPDGYRTAGPVQISVNSASAETLQIVAEALIGDTHTAEVFVGLLIKDRDDNGGQVSPSGIGTAAQDAQIDPEIRTRLVRMLTIHPTLYYATIELRDSSIGPPLARYGGYFTVASAGAGRAAPASASATRSTFLTWEKLSTE